MQQGKQMAEISAQNRERAIQARNKRRAQLKKWSQLDKQSEKEFKHLAQSRSNLGPRAPIDVTDDSYCVKFCENVILLEAATREDEQEVRRLLSKGVSPDLANEDGLTPLHQCCIDNAIEMCKIMLSFRANVNARDTENWTPLHAAATCGHTELCKLLIDSGADLLALNAEGNMPYDICDHDTTLDLIETEMAARGITQENIDKKREEPERIMLDDMQRIGRETPHLLSECDSQGATPLHIAAANGYYQVAEYLVSRKVSSSIEDRDGWLPIHVAACWGHLEIIELLVSFGADIEARTKQGQGESVFEICEDKEMKERLNEIKREAEDLNSKHRPQLMRRKSSTNTRSQSVRRTSMRDKTKTSWKEARMEADIRLSKEIEISGMIPPDGGPLIPFPNSSPRSDPAEFRDATSRQYPSPAQPQLPLPGTMEHGRPAPGGVSNGGGSYRSSRQASTLPPGNSTANVEMQPIGQHSSQYQNIVFDNASFPHTPSGGGASNVRQHPSYANYSNYPAGKQSEGGNSGSLMTNSSASRPHPNHSTALDMSFNSRQNNQTQPGKPKVVMTPSYQPTQISYNTSKPIETPNSKKCCYLL